LSKSLLSCSMFSPPGLPMTPLISFSTSGQNICGKPGDY
jgi:hypothetical protein